MQRSDKVLVLFDTPTAAPLDHDFAEELKNPDWATEANVVKALQAREYPVELLGVFDDTNLIHQKIAATRPDVVFNLVETFNNNSSFDQHIASFLELQGVPFTGCGAMGMTLCKHKDLAKQILGFHRIRVPAFSILQPGRKIARPKRLKFPIFIKPLREEASYGISQASFVDNDTDFRQRVEFIHEKFQQDAIAEEYIEGRELYVSILGNDRLRAFPIRELVFREVPPDEPKFASYKAKWDEDYRKRWGIANQFARGLDAELVKQIERVCKRIYRLLAITGYARLDLRLTADGQIVFIEANPNPILATEEDFAQSALKDGLTYPDLIEKILALGKSTPRG